MTVLVPMGLSPPPDRLPPNIDDLLFDLHHNLCLRELDRAEVVQLQFEEPSATGRWQVANVYWRSGVDALGPRWESINEAGQHEVYATCTEAVFAVAQNMIARHVAAAIELHEWESTKTLSPEEHAAKGGRR